MRLLFLHSNVPDYLADGVFHGLREILGDQCVDFPRYDIMYSPLQTEIRKGLRGHGFTLYGLLPELPELAPARDRWRQEIARYDVVVIANIWRQIPLYLELSKVVPPRKLVVLDGADASECFPYATRLRSSPSAYFTPVRQSLYFKRELLSEGESFGPLRYLPRSLRRRLGIPRQVVPLSFSIPACKITRVAPDQKLKEFNRDIIDPELAESERSKNMRSAFYPFEEESQYYADLQASRFGITTRRAGWDCMRHYEIAANGAVLAFRRLNQKPECCAPHGLSAECCLIYQNREDLTAQIQAMTPGRYAAMQQAGYAWAEANTTVRRAEGFLQRYHEYEQGN